MGNNALATPSVCFYDSGYSAFPMDIVVPSHAVKQFTNSIVALSKISSSIYLEFDRALGLWLRSLNDAKSAYAELHYAPNFFERCTAPPTQLGRNERKRKHGGQGNKQHHNDDNEDAEDNDTNDPSRFTCRLAVKALSPIFRPRKYLQQLRITTTTASDQIPCLKFEFTIQKPTTLCTIVHRIRYADAVGVVTAVANTDESSEIVASPKIFSSLLEPLTRLPEVALIVRKTGSVSACSFHHTDATLIANAENDQNHNIPTNNNAILQASTASLLKSETACSSDEFLEFDFVSNRDTDQDPSLPDNVNDEVILVFAIKESKSFLQFCSSIPELAVHVYFDWGGKPMVWKAASEEASSSSSWEVQWVLATLDHRLLTSLRTVASES